jgi:hypothetical protein
VRRIARVAGHAPLAVLAPAVDADHHALAAEAAREHIDQRGILERGRVDADLVGAVGEHGLGRREVANPAGDAERDVEQFGNARHPAAIHRPSPRARRDVVEHELVGALVAISARELEDAAHVAMIAEPHALDDASVAHVEAGNYAFCKNERISSSVMRPSSRPCR